jgi:hypothetical protein
MKSNAIACIYADVAGGRAYLQSRKGKRGGDGSRPNAAEQFEEGTTAKFVPVTVSRWKHC